MVTVAVLLLPGLGLLLFTMTYLEDRLFGDPEPPRHARRRHLRLIRGGRDTASPARRPKPAEKDRSPGRHAA
ncbi:hypothetical protein ACH4NS_16100 [Streptomyces mutabilis]|uniref:hypothetical protein n=1 Tax=Streptomyces TaxID=1883 RepID=UPI000BDDD85A|nr:MULTISPECIES: hypothetical protein [unclassified Streptomyces]MDG9689182.1 hypothetical protein [Streptomyces sp. DH17]MDN3243964.1 hypothetical protein [Streptomyces sp. ZSW22]MDN3255877.1 hypothetical protein [Streptomyces sp. MA25(2023)]MDQ0383895.1 hypothetical protein [Streptomyces sp. DSM 42143]PAK26101.1 hypothetical protein CJD44_12560 [Streptomyces sp. alain-838]